MCPFCLRDKHPVKDCPRGMEKDRCRRCRSTHAQLLGCKPPKTKSFISKAITIRRGRKATREKRIPPNRERKSWEMPYTSPNYRQRPAPQIFDTQAKNNKRDQHAPTTVSYTSPQNKSTKPNSSPTGHIGVRCDGCDEEDFVSNRYKCTTCPNYDLCENCYKNFVVTPPHSGNHVMRSIGTPEPYPARMNFIGYVTRPPNVHHAQEIEATKPAFVGDMNISSSVHPIAPPKPGTKICALHGEQESERAHATSKCE